jgi:hemolysin activation/secretion protein
MATARKGACGAIIAMVVVPAVFAQSTREYVGGAGIGVSGYAIEGRALLRAEDLTPIIAPSSVGRQKSVADVARARAAVQQAIHGLGNCSVSIDTASSLSPDGVAASRMTDTSAPVDRNCLPVIALDGPGNSPASGVVIAPHVEGGGSRGLTFSLDSQGQSDERVSGDGTARRKMTSSRERPVTLAMSDAVSGSPAIALPASAVDAGISLSATARPLPIAGAAGPDVSRTPGRPAERMAQASPAAISPAEVVPAPPAGAPKFEIRIYVVEGNTLLTREKIDRVLAPFTGKNKDFGDVQRALEALQSAYQEVGYGSVEIRLPEQELERGEVKFVAIEAKIGRIVVEGNEHFTSGNIRRSVPALREGETPNSRDIAQSIRLANENPAKQSTVLLKGAEQEGQIDATIRVADIKPSRYSISLDNTGNENTGNFRLGLAYQHANLFDRDHVLTAQYLTSPQNINDVNVFGLGYRIPLYTRGDSVDLVVGYSDVNSGTVQNLFNVTGAGTVYALRYNQGLSKWGDIEHKLAYGLDYRAYQNSVKPVGGNANLVPDITVHPFSVTYLASLRQEQSEWSAFLSFVQNLPGMNDGTDDIFKKARFQVGTAGYRLFRFGGSYNRSIAGDWQARIRLDAQYTDDSLVTGEQFAVGGADNVRGFNERFTSNDKGYRTNWEVYSPDWGKRLGLSDGRVRFLAFYDTGTTRRNQPLPGEHDTASLDSWGLGVRLSYKNYFTARMDISQVLHDGTQGLVTDGRRNLTVVHFSTAWVW